MKQMMEKYKNIRTVMFIQGNRTLKSLDFIKISNEQIIFEGFDKKTENYFIVFEMPINIKIALTQNTNKDLWINCEYGKNVYDTYSTHYMRPLCNKEEFYELPKKIISTAYAAHMDGAACPKSCL